MPPEEDRDTDICNTRRKFGKDRMCRYGDIDRGQTNSLTDRQTDMVTTIPSFSIGSEVINGILKTGGRYAVTTT